MRRFTFPLFSIMALTFVPGLADGTRHVIGCRFTQEMRLQGIRVALQRISNPRHLSNTASYDVSRVSE